MIPLLHYGSFALYSLAGALFGVSVAREARRLTVLATFLVGAGLVLHAAALADYSASWNQLPLVGLGPSLSTLAFLTGLGSLAAATLGHATIVGLVLAPIIAALTGVAALAGLAPAGEANVFEGAWFALHVVFAFVGYAGLAVAFAAGLIYLIQFRELKGKHFGAIFRFFPPLDTLDRLGLRGLQVGFPFLTLALLLGWAWSSSFAGSAGPGRPKLAWVTLTWAVFVAALLSRVGGGRRAERGALASVLGFVVVVVLYVVLRAQAVQQGTFL